MKGGRRQGRQRKKWEDNIREWTGLELSKSQRGVENREKMEKTGCKIICCAPTTLAVKGLMMMMMNVHCLPAYVMCWSVSVFVCPYDVCVSVSEAVSIRLPVSRHVMCQCVFLKLKLSPSVCLCVDTISL